MTSAKTALGIVNVLSRQILWIGRCVHCGVRGERTGNEPVDKNRLTRYIRLAVSHAGFDIGWGERDRLLVYTPQHIANYFLDRASEEGRAMSPLKLIKLVYIGYGWVLALTNNKLFDEPIEAWQHGPVIPSVYHEFKHFRSSAITSCAASFDMETMEYRVPRIPASDKLINLILEKVWAAYKTFSGWALREKTHEPDTPWTATYDGSMDKQIPDDLISQHFHRKIREIVDTARATDA
jgi:uncharacterized phage-associated protein